MKTLAIDTFKERIENLCTNLHNSTEYKVPFSIYDTGAEGVVNVTIDGSDFTFIELFAPNKNELRLHRKGVRLEFADADFNTIILAFINAG